MENRLKYHLKKREERAHSKEEVQEESRRRGGEGRGSMLWKRNQEDG